MPSKNPLKIQFTLRDRDILAALARTPLTATQLLEMSQTFVEPFTQERLVRRRLQALTAAGWAATFRYFTTEAGVLNYYKVAPAGYRLLNGEDAILPKRSFFNPVSPSLQQHTRDLADFIVHTQVHALRFRSQLPPT
ncbi:MAG: hypothetical protein KDA42_18500 [Planctomycetales bacterium]|nr:hypothetical protein [Planctomycetales bacterium]